jgi:hypothetical protein
MERYGQKLNFTMGLENLYLFIEWTFRGFVFLLTLLQLMIRHSTTGLYCIERAKILSSEGKWLSALILLQLAKLVIMTYWHVTIVR